MKTFRPLLVLALGIALAAAGPAAADDAEAYQQLFRSIQRNPAGASERDLARLMTMGAELGTPFPAHLAANSFLAQRMDASPETLLQAAEIAAAVGEYPLAVSRYKAYLDRVTPSEAASRAAHRLYTIQIDFLQNEDDAFATMKSRGGNFRQSPLARQFDGWFLAQARSRNDFAAFAQRLDEIWQDRGPEPAKLVRFGTELDWIFATAGRGQEAHFEALPILARLMGRIRDADRLHRYRVQHAHLEFRSRAVGRSDEDRATLFERGVLRAADAAIKASPSAALGQDIVSFLGWRGDLNWDDDRDGKQAVFEAVVGALRGDELTSFLAWATEPAGQLHRLASAEAWSRIALAQAPVLRELGVLHRVPLAPLSTDRGELRRQAQALSDVASADAAVIRALASSDQYAAMLNTLMSEDAWHLGLGDLRTLGRDRIWNGLVARLRAADPDREISGSDRDRVWAEFGRRHIATTLAALDAETAREWLWSAWRHGGENPNDKRYFIQDAEAILWASVGWSDRDRRDLGSLQNEINGWANNLRRSHQREQDGVTAEMLEQIQPISQAMGRLREGDHYKRATAPNPITLQRLQAEIAIQDRNANDYLRAAGALYDRVREPERSKAPFAREALRFTLSDPGRGIGVVDFQVEKLADQIRRSRQRNAPALALQAASWIPRGKDQHARWDHVDREQVERFNAVFAEGLMADLEANRFDRGLFNFYRSTRSGHRWRNWDLNPEPIRKIHEDHAFLRHGVSIDGRGPTASLMHLVANEFSSLAREDLPPATAFDDLFLREARETRVLDRAYWEHGRDESGRIRAHAADVFLAHSGPIFAAGSGFASPSDAAFWLTRALQAEDKRDALIAHIEGQLEAGNRADALSAGRAWLDSHNDTDFGGDRAEWFRRLDRYIQRVSQLPVRPTAPDLTPLTGVGDPTAFSRAEREILVRLITEAAPATWSRGRNHEHLPVVLGSSLMAADETTRLAPLIPAFWKIARDTDQDGLRRYLAGLGHTLLEAGHPDLAAVMSSAGQTVARGRLPQDIRDQLGALRSQALGAVGGIIPVERSDPRYPIFQAQADYIAGRRQIAWEGYAAHADRVSEALRELDPAFTIWLIEENTTLRRFEQATTLAREMIAWVDTVQDSFDPEVRARLLLAFAGIPQAQREFPRARALYERIATAPELSDTRGASIAQIRIAEVDRLTQNYDAATDRLQRLTRARDPEIQAEAFYHLALVMFDQEDFEQSSRFLTHAFDRRPHHEMGRILEGELNLRLRRLVEATQVNVGITSDLRYIVPGRPLRVTVEDRNLSVIGRTSDVEIRAWTDAGDVETFLLLPFGDSRTKFSGSLPTALGDKKPGDGVLQLLGDDQVHFDFSPRFREQNNITQESVRSLYVVSDPELYVSSGRILTREEQEERAFEAMLREQAGLAGPQADDPVALSVRRPENQVRPGNPINIKVVDQDRSVTNQPDTVYVEVRATSGDVVSRFPLTETGPVTGVFEGRLPTDAAPATAFASDSQVGSEPNFVISSQEYPPWVAMNDSARPKSFSVDLNDNVELGVMDMKAGVAGRRLRSFLLQTSFNGRDFTTVGSWPDAFQPWDGSLRVTLARMTGLSSRPSSDSALRAFLDEGHLRTGDRKIVRPLSNFAASWDRNVDGQAGAMNLSGDGAGSWYVAHVQGAFFQAQRQVRTLNLEVKQDPSIAYFFYVNGRLVNTTASPEFEFSESLGRGVHQIDLYIAAQRGAEPRFELHTDIPEPPYLAPAPAAMFDLAAQPEVRQAIYREPAAIEATENQDAFRIAFSEGTRARMFRLLITDYETDAPAIEKIALTDRAGERILPTTTDFMTLRENQILEIIPGDRITVRYEPERHVSRDLNRLERHMSATYHDAQISAVFVEYRTTGTTRTASYVPMRRFEPGDVINVFIRDPDMDVSEEPDTVEFTATIPGGKSVTLTALETAPHSGVFLGRVFPVTGEPQRDSELKVGPDDNIVLTYFDETNTSPGIPWERAITLEQAWWVDPEVRAWSVRSMELPEGVDPGARTLDTGETVPALRDLLVERPETLAEAETVQPVVIGGPLLVEVLFPTIAKAPNSTTSIYVQTASGRELREPNPELPFDTTVPGTLRITSTPSGAGVGELPPGYRQAVLRGDPFATTPMDDGRFTFRIPYQLGEPPQRSLVPDGTGVEEPLSAEDRMLRVRGDDTVFVAYTYEDEAGDTHWVTRSVQLDSDVFFDIMDRRFQETLTGLYVGETAYFRVIHPSMDTTPDRDVIQLRLQASSGHGISLDLTETFSHSGQFRGIASMGYARGRDRDNPPPDTLLVDYGDTVTATYTTPAGAEYTRSFEIFKGADGDVMTFTKRFQDENIAVQTQFAIAEAYFELAKRYRDLGEVQLSREVIGQGRRVLQEAIRDFPHTDAQPHAEYLLANLALEFAEDAKEANPEIARQHFREAIQRFTDVVQTYPDSDFAPRSQFKKALTLELMGEIDLASEEYVRLSYRYPTHELVAETIARLGQYFLAKGREMQDQIEKATDPLERERIRLQQRKMFTTSAQVFGRLAPRFPTHRLAVRATVLSAQSWMRAENYEEAIATFEKVINDPTAEPALIAESMYWAGDSHMRLGSPADAYMMFTRLTWDYPADRFARFARGRLTEPALVRAGASLDR